MDTFLDVVVITTVQPTILDSVVITTEQPTPFQLCFFLLGVWLFCSLFTVLYVAIFRVATLPVLAH